MDFVFRVKPRPVAIILSLAVLLSIFAAIIYILVALLRGLQGGSALAIYVVILIIAVVPLIIIPMLTTSIRVSLDMVYAATMLPIVRCSIKRHLVEDISTVDLSVEGGLKPVLRLMGVWMPG